LILDDGKLRKAVARGLQLSLSVRAIIERILIITRSQLTEKWKTSDIGVEKTVLRRVQGNILKRL
jgi:hypothetical protein